MENVVRWSEFWLFQYELSVLQLIITLCWWPDVLLGFILFVCIRHYNQCKIFCVTQQVQSRDVIKYWQSLAYEPVCSRPYSHNTIQVAHAQSHWQLHGEVYCNWPCLVNRTSEFQLHLHVQEHS